MGHSGLRPQFSIPAIRHRCSQSEVRLLYCHSLPTGRHQINTSGYRHSGSWLAGIANSVHVWHCHQSRHIHCPVSLAPGNRPSPAPASSRNESDNESRVGYVCLLDGPIHAQQSWVLGHTTYRNTYWSGLFRRTTSSSGGPIGTGDWPHASLCAECHVTEQVGRDSNVVIAP